MDVFLAGTDLAGSSAAGSEGSAVVLAGSGSKATTAFTLAF